MIWGIYDSPQTSQKTFGSTYPYESFEIDILDNPTSQLDDSSTEKWHSTCGQTGVLTVLMVNHDLSGEVWQYGANAFHIMRVDYNQKTIRIITIPNHLWMRTPVLEFQNKKNSRLGLVYYDIAQTTNGTFQQKAIKGVLAILQTLVDNFIPIPAHYIVFETGSLAQMIDEIGGVDLDIPHSIVTDSYSFNSGLQNLDGQMSLTYIQYLLEEASIEDLQKQEYRNRFITSLQLKLLEPANLVKVPSLIEKFKQYYVSDLTPDLIASLVCMLSEVPTDRIDYLSITPEMMIGPGPDISMIPDVVKVIKFLQEQLAP